MVRAKFKVTAVASDANNPDAGGAVRLEPVTGGSAENEQFFRYTPGGGIDLNTVNSAALAQFQQGEEYYVDFTHVPRVAPAA